MQVPTNNMGETRNRKGIKLSRGNQDMVNRGFADQSLRVTIRSRESLGRAVIEARETGFPLRD